MVWIFEKKKEPVSSERRKRDVDEYLLAKMKQSGLAQKLEHINSIRWTDKDNAADASVVLKDLMNTCHGLVRSGRIPDSAIGAVSRLIARWQAAIDAGRARESMSEALEINLKQIYTKYTLMASILPSDIGEEIAMPPIEWLMSHLNPNYVSQQKGPAEELKD